MKKKLFTFFAIVAIAGFALCNVYEFGNISSNEFSLEKLVVLNVANAEDSTWGDYYIQWYTPNDVFCWPGGYFCCPGWGDCEV